MDLTRLTVRRPRRSTPTPPAPAPAAPVTPAATTTVADVPEQRRAPVATEHRVDWPGASGPAPLHFTLPPGLHRLPLPPPPGVAVVPQPAASGQDGADQDGTRRDGTGREGAGGVDKLVRILFPRAEAVWRTRMTDHYRAVAGVYARRGLRFAAVGFFAAPPEGGEHGLVHAAFTVAAVRSAHTSAVAAVCALAETVHREGDSDVEPVLLPCGPAVSVAHRDLAPLKAPGDDRRLPTAHFQLRVPSPTTPWTYILDMATTSSTHWAGVATLAARIAESVVLG